MNGRRVPGSLLVLVLAEKFVQATDAVQEVARTLTAATEPLRQLGLKYRDYPPDRGVIPPHVLRRKQQRSEKRREDRRRRDFQKRRQ